MSRMYRSGANFAKPENALKRAEELEAVGQKQAAVQALHDVITSKRHRTWQKTLEDIMFKYIDLCVEMKRGRYAKDGLIQYRNVCQQVNVNSLEEVIKYFLNKASEKAEEAQAQAEVKDVAAADLDEDVSPEDLMLSYVSGDKSKDRTERELVTPWFKFLWETYRNCLDILRNNSKLEALYAMTAQRAFQFCLQYKRTTEFRRLCDILRNHLTNLNKYREQRDRPDITQPETLQLYLETRFEQLKVACDLEMWQEAFRSVEDIHGLMQYGKKAPKPQMMAVYYAKLTQIFAVGNSSLYHAYSWYKLYNLSKQYNKNMSADDQKMMACAVLLAALSILPYDQKDSYGDNAQERDRSARMAAILGFSVDVKRDSRDLLSRSALLSDLMTKGIQNLVPPEIAEIHTLLESDFNPLELCSKIEPLIARLKEVSLSMSAASPVAEVSLGFYQEQLRRQAVLRMCEQLGQVYSVISIEKMASLVPFVDLAKVELIIVDAVKYGHLQLRLDHRNGTLHFGASQMTEEKMKGHLSLLAKRLCKASAMISPASQDKQQAIAASLEARATVDQEHKLAIARKVIIERRKEEQEQRMLEHEKQEEEKRLLQARINEEAEEKRLAAERLKREEERIRREMEARELEEAKALMQAAGKKGRVLKEGEKIDRQALMHEALTEQLKERQELERKLARLTKQMDHFERAKREEEVPLLLKAYDNRMVEDEVYHKEQQAAYLLQHKESWSLDVQEKLRLTRMKTEREVFSEQVMARRAEEFAALQAARRQRISEMKIKRKMEREMERKRRYIARCREEEEHRLLAEAEARLKAEEAAMRAEEEARRAEEAERRARLDAIAAKQREREEEMERRKAEERAALASAPAVSRVSGNEERDWGRKPPPASDPAPPARSGGYVPPSRRGAVASAEAYGKRNDDDRWTRGSRDAPPRGGQEVRREMPQSSRDGPSERWGSSRRDDRGPRRDDRGAPPPREQKNRW